MRAFRYSAWFVGIAAACASCAQTTPIETRTVTVHVPGACGAQTQPYALFYASGDYPTAPDAPPVEQLFLDSTNADLSHIPGPTRALVVDVSDAPSGVAWSGIGGVAPAGDVDVLLWPSASACALTQPTALVDGRTNAAFGAIDARHILVAGGRGSGSVVASFVADLTTGEVTPVTSDLLAARMQASVTPFGDVGALVAGGARPDTGELLASAEVFLATGDFDGVPILLSGGRADHGALALSTGEALLVGGMGEKGPLGSLELIDPKTRRSRTAGLAVLDTPRAHPTVLRLASGEIFVAGGVDAAGAPVGTVEWLTPDGRAHSKPSRALAATKERGFVALPGGGALAVMVPDAPTPRFTNVWVISAAGDLEPAPMLVGELDAVRLFSGNRGAPMLWTGKRWLRWQPFAGQFAPVQAAINAAGPATTDVLAAPDGGLALWLSIGSAGTRVVGFRFDARSAYENDSARTPLLLDSADLFSPDRLVVPGVTSAFAFDSTHGLTLAAGASAFLTDATFADFSLDLAVPGGVAPLVVLRDDNGVETVIGGAACPFDAPVASKIHLERHADAISFATDAGDSRACASVDPLARLRIGVRGGPAGGAVHGLSVLRIENPP